jgi:hypothetical protein
MTLAGTAASFRVWLTMGALMMGLGSAAIVVLVVLDRQRPPVLRAEEMSYLPKGEYLRVAVIGYRQMAADLIWLKAVQYIGEKKQSKRGYLAAYHAVDVLTDVDPRFAFAYQATGTVLGVYAHLVQESIAILSKGMRHNPEVWQLPFTIGYDYFYELCDPAKAAPYFRTASVLPGAPAYLPKLAARMTVAGGDPDAALEFLQRLDEQVQDQRLHGALVQKMREVLAERDIRSLEDAVRRYRVRYGRMPRKLGDLLNGGIIEAIPVEPLGGTYELNAADGSVTATGLRERLKVHRFTPCREAKAGGR